MPSTDPLSARPSRTPGSVAVSVLLHLVVLAAILHRPAAAIAPMRFPGTSHGSRIELTYSPGSAPVRTSVPNPRSAPKQVASATPLPSLLAPPKPAPTSPNVTAPTSAQPDSAAGADALGDGNVSIALAAFFPRPKPDLSPLPHGTAGDVILDVVIDSNGKISDIKITHSINPTIDQTVVSTVQQWTFHPATKDGQPIASEQELHFHYERG